MADRDNNKTFYAGMKLRTMNRSEFDDSLIRHNQRYNNRLQQEIQAVEKAQRIIAKGLDKESQWFRQKLSTPTVTSTSTPRVKKNSFSEFGSAWAYSGSGFSPNARLVPDYQYHRKMSSSLPMSAASSTVIDDDGKAGRRDSTDGADTMEKRVRERAQGDSESSQSKRKSSRAKEGEKNSRIQHNRDKKASVSSKGGDPPNGSRLGTETARAPPSSGPAEPSAEIAELSLVGVESKETKGNFNVQASHMAHASAAISAAESVASGSRSAHAQGVTGRQQAARDDVTSTTTLSATVARDLNWDGRRRYTNVWDMLSTPKHVPTNRSVRARLEKELSHGDADRRGRNPKH